MRRRRRVDACSRWSPPARVDAGAISPQTRFIGGVAISEGWGGMFDSVEVLVAVATVASAAVSLFVNFVYQEYIRPHREKRRARRDTLTKVGMPMLRAAKSAGSYVDLFLRERRRKWYESDPDGMFRMSILYALAELFAWARRIEEEAFIDIAPPEERAGAFHYALGRVFKALTSLAYFRHMDEESKEAAIKAGVPRRALQAVGELMIVRERAFVEDEPRILSFHSFARRYEHDPDFRRWMDVLGAPFLAAERDKDGMSLARIALLANNLQIFAVFLERYLDVQSTRRERTKRIYVSHDRLLPKSVLEQLLKEHARNDPPVRLREDRTKKTETQKSATLAPAEG